MLVDHVGDPNHSSFVCMEGQETVKHVVSDVDLPVGKPASEGRVFGIEDGLGESVPVDFLGLLLPELLAEVWGGSFSKGLFVGVLSHDMKIIMAVCRLHLKNPPSNLPGPCPVEPRLLLQLPHQ